MTALTQYDAARAALAEATRIDQVLPLLDEFELAKVRARQIKDQSLLADATEFQLRAERRLGQVLDAAKAAGLFKQGKRKTSDEEVSPRPTLAEAGIDHKLSSRAQKRASIAEQAFEAMVQRTRERIASGAAKIVPSEAINGARAIMGSRVEPDDSLDYFPTPPWATRALMEIVLPSVRPGANAPRFDMIGEVWEPACGEGHIAEVLREYCSSVFASDIHDYGYQDDLLDFLDAEQDRYAPDWIITNPPFGDVTLAFIETALNRARVGVAMFVRTQWAMEGVERYHRLFKDRPPFLTGQFVERVPLCKGRWEPEGSTATAYCWLVWRIQDVDQWRGFDSILRIPPGQREALTKPDDAERFTQHPVTKLVRCDEPFDASTGEIVATTHKAEVEEEGLEIPAFLRRSA